VLHGCGVVCGLSVTPAAERCSVVVSTGYALDSCGDEILVEQEVLLRLSSREHAEDGADLGRAELEEVACPNGSWTVAVRYAARPSQLVPVIGEDDTPQPNRIRETYELCALATLPAPSADYERDRKLGRRGDIDACPPCPPDPEARWVVLAEVRIQEGRVTVRDLRPITGSWARG
jgi:hypothetical protein